MNFKTILLILVFLSQAVKQTAQVFIDPKIAQLSDNEVEVLITFDQAELSGALMLDTKDAKAKYVYEQLVKITTLQVDVKNVLNDLGINYQSFYIVNCISTKIPTYLIPRIATLPNVTSIVHNSSLKMLSSPRENDEGSRAIEWGVTKVGAPDVWALGYTGSGVVVGGQDTGYEWDHSALKNKYRGWNGTDSLHNYNWHDAISTIDVHNTGSNPCGLNIPYPCDDNNHGTHTMGTMAGDDGGSNQIGVAPGSQWIGCRNMERGWGTPATYLECFEWFMAPYPFDSNEGEPNTALMPHVINNSWGCPPSEGCNPTNFPILNTAVEALRNAGCVVIVSAGNDGSGCNTVNSPAAIFEGSLSVGATNNNDAIANFSSRGSVTVDGSNRTKPNVSAPGVGVRSCVRGPAYASYNGTSMAGPHVAGVVALLISANPMLAGKVALIEDILEQTAVHLTSTQSCSGTSGSSIPNNTFGYGRVDALAAVQMSTVSTYSPFVTTPSYIIISINKGLVIKNSSGQNYRLTVQNGGTITSNAVTSISNGSTVIKNSSIYVSNDTGGLILTSPDGTFYKLSINSSGQLNTTALSTVSKYISIEGDLHVEGDLKGFIIKNEVGNCHLVKLSTLGSIMVIPSVCP